MAAVAIVRFPAVKISSWNLTELTEEREKGRT